MPSYFSSVIPSSLRGLGTSGSRNALRCLDSQKEDQGRHSGAEKTSQTVYKLQSCVADLSHRFRNRSLACLKIGLENTPHTEENPRHKRPCVQCWGRSRQ
jgi:hypothetical protein